MKMIPKYKNVILTKRIKINLLAVTILLILSSALTYAQTPAQKAKILQKSNVSKLAQLKTQYTKKAAQQKTIAIEAAKRNGWEITKELPNGGFAELQRLTEDGSPIYYKTFNVAAAASTRTNHLNSSGSLGLSLEGQDMKIHIWDGGHVLNIHQEFLDADANTRVILKDIVSEGGIKNSVHANHVAGTLAAKGVNSLVKGMAPEASVDSYMWNNDLAEATAAAADGMLVSNHSYGWLADGLSSLAFGGYIGQASEWDDLLYNAPYYLMVVAAGNDGEESYQNAQPLEGNSTYDKLMGASVIKNNLVVGSSADATVDTHGNMLSPVAPSSFSSQGPTDDYRIKPDIAGNGEDVYSVYTGVSGNTFEYYDASGTSMASPNVAGSLLLLQQHYENLRGDFMRASTLKGLALHTADDIGSVGPDAVSGWGVLNAKAAAETISNTDTRSKVEELTLSAGQSYTVTVESDGVNPLLASISWTDPAGTVQTVVNDNTPVLVNDLDIFISKGSTTFMPYKLTSVTSNDTGDNTVDPFERVDVANAFGTYTITITHKGSLSGGSQDYALIVTGIKETSAVCQAEVPEQIEMNNIDGIQATVSWASIPFTSYEIQHRKEGTTTWITTVTSESITTIEGLTQNTAYELQVRSLCSDGSFSSYSDLMMFTTSGLTYCTFSGGEFSSTEEYIHNVTLGSINNTTEIADGYSDHTSQSTNLMVNTAYDISITPGWTGGIFEEGYAVWIDYNQNQSFEDDGELVWSHEPTTASTVNGTFTVPASALNGITRMRVSMKFNETPTSSCEEDYDYQYYGEVEDYTVNIINDASDTEAPSIPTGLTATNVQNTSVDLSWVAATDNVGVAGYEIFQDGVSAASVTSTTAVLSGLTVNTTYTFSVRAFDAAGNNSQVSNTIEVTTEDDTIGGFVPDPNKKYYIDAAYFNMRLAATGESEDAYLTSTTTTGPDVEWQFVAKGNGYWHLQRAAGGSRPRMRTDLTENPDMRPTSFNATYTYMDITDGAMPNTYFMTYIHAPTVLYNRLQVDNYKQLKMVGDDRNGTWESFTITEVTDDTPTINTVLIQENESGYCSVDGAIENNHTGYTGDGFSNTVNALGNGVYWEIDGGAGEYTFTWRYASASDRPADLLVNGSVVMSNIQFDATANWSTWTTQMVTVNLAAGIKSIDLQSTRNPGLGNIDYMEVTGPNVSGVSCLEAKAENAEITKLNVGIYPSPATSILNVNIYAEDFNEIVIFSPKGGILKKIYTKESELSIDVSQFSSGMYFAKFISPTTSITKRFIKQ